MDWRTLVLILSLFLNGYLLNSVRKLDFQTRELTQSASRARQTLSSLGSQLEQMAGAAPASIRDLISERELDELIRKMAAAEADALTTDCGPKMIRNSNRLRSLQARLKTFNTRYEEVVKKATENNLKDPRQIQQIAAQLKAEVLRECRP